ncbi:MAG: NADH-quinone oxidoreductase subunit C [Bacteroidota bacterium]
MSNFLEKLQQESLQDFIVEVRGHAGEMTIEVKSEHIHQVLQTLKNEYGFNYLADISGSDMYTDEGRFEVAYNIVSIPHQQRLRVSCRVEEDTPAVDSVVDVWSAADWFEREVFDMIGITFNNHPDLRRMFMPEDYEWHPLRKEFPLLGIPGSIPLPEKDPPKQYK